MLKTFLEIFQFLKNPSPEKDKNENIHYVANKFFKILILCFVSIFIITPILGIIEVLQLVDTSEHAIDDLLNNESKIYVFFFAAVVAPFFEELIFRGPLVFFKSKRNYKYALYISTILFGLIHIINYNLSTSVILFAPLLVAPQIILGFYLAFTRTKFGLRYSIMLHAAYNGILTLIMFLAD